MTGNDSKWLEIVVNITLQKHKNTKHAPNYCSPNKKIRNGKFELALDAINGKEFEAEALRPEWNQQNKDEKKYVEDDKKKDDNETLKMRRSAKKVKCWI